MKTFYKFLCVIDVNKKSLPEAEDFLRKKMTNKKLVIRKIEQLGKERI